MEYPNVALIRGMYDALAQGDYASVRERFHEGAVWHLPGDGPLTGDHIGVEAVLATMRRFDERSGGTIRVEVHDIMANDKHAVALLHARATRAAKRYDSLEADVFHTRDGKVTEFWSLAQDQRLTDEFWA